MLMPQDTDHPEQSGEPTQAPSVSGVPFRWSESALAKRPNNLRVCACDSPVTRRAVAEPAPEKIGIKWEIRLWTRQWTGDLDRMVVQESAPNRERSGNLLCRSKHASWRRLTRWRMSGVSRRYDCGLESAMPECCSAFPPCAAAGTPFVSAPR